MLKKSLTELLFKGFSIQRWNDKLRPIELIETDKHSHKMMIAYCLAKYEEQEGLKVDWLNIIKGGIYEYLRRIIISDIQQPVYREIEKNSELVSKLNKWVWHEIQSKIGNNTVREEMEEYLLGEDFMTDDSKNILQAAHIYASYWEFNIIKNLNVQDYQIDNIASSFKTKLNECESLSGIFRLNQNHGIKNFIDLCGQMRYQIRWGQLPRIPRTSVLGHVMLVASLSFMLTNEIDNPAPKRIYNNFFGALFHDLPEAVTRDIISPLKKKVPGMGKEISRIEDYLMNKEVIPHLEPSWIDEINMFTKDEFKSKINGNQITTSNEINKKYNSNEFNPYDGELIKAADELAAFLEVWSSIRHGIKSNEMEEAMWDIRYRYIYDGNDIAGIPLNELYEDF